jgi:TctA family transporter
MVSQKGILPALISCTLGVLIGFVGTDVNSGAERFTFGFISLADGVSFVCVALGCFGLAEIIKNIETGNTYSPFSGNIKLLPGKKDFLRIIPSAVRGSFVGAILGVIPGGGPHIAQFAAYSIEKKFSKNKNEIGKGAPEGLAGPAAADESAARTSFIPLLTLGLPENAVMAVMLGAFMIKGIHPGPEMITAHPDIFWGLVASMWIGNIFLLIINVPFARYLLSVFRIPYDVLFVGILFFICLGSYGINNNLIDIYITCCFGLLGYMMVKMELEPAPLMLGLIMGPILEEYFRRALLISDGSFLVFVNRRLGAIYSVFLCLIFFWNIYKMISKLVRV